MVQIGKIQNDYHQFPGKYQEIYFSKFLNKLPGKFKTKIKVEIHVTRFYKQKIKKGDPMHELQVTESILNIALKHSPADKVKKIIAIHLTIGELSELEDEWLQHYFDYLSKGTLAQGAKLVIERSPIRMECNACNHPFQIKRDGIKHIECPQCHHHQCTLISGREYHIKHLEVL